MRLAILLSLTSAGLLAQRITAVRNAASYSNGFGWGHLVSVFGTNLATRTETAATLPLPTTLAGTSVKFAGVPAFLLYISPTQINLQVPYYPYELPLTVEVTTPNGTTGPVDPRAGDPTWPGASVFGFFTADGSGCGLAAALNVDRTTGATSAHSRTNSVSPGEFVTLFGTGFSYYIPAVPLPDGNPNPMSPLFASGDPRSSWVDFADAFRVGGGISWSGKAPGLVGVDQVNLHVPLTAREGCAVPLQTSSTGTSRPVTLAIRRGGGPCVDPAPVGYGEILWERAELTNLNGQVSVEETMTASLQASPGQRIPLLSAYTQPSFITGFPVLDPLRVEDRRLWQYFGPPCPIPGYRSLAAGTINAEASGRSFAASVVPIPFSQIPGLTFYRATLNAGTIQTGTYRVLASGGADVPAFQSSLAIGSGIRITSTRYGFGRREPLMVEWTGGDPDSWVTVIARSGSAEQGEIHSRRLQVRAGAGVARMEKVSPDFVLGIPEPIRDIVVEVTPDPSRIVSFEVPGLALVRHSWKYTYRFPQPVP